MHNIIDIQSSTAIDMAQFFNNVAVMKQIVMVRIFRVSLENLSLAWNGSCLGIDQDETQVLKIFLDLIRLMEIEIFVVWECLNIDF